MDSFFQGRPRALIAALLATAAVLSAGAVPAAALVIDTRAVKDFTALDFDRLARGRIVTATLREADPFDLPFMAVALTRADHDDRRPPTLRGWLDGLAGVTGQTTANGQGSPFIRGVTGFQTLFRIDGIRLNNPVFRDRPNQHWNTVAANSISSPEVVKGPGSALHGSDAARGEARALNEPRRDLVLSGRVQF